MQRRFAVALVCAATTLTAPTAAQLAGTFLIDPSTSTAFQSFTEAVNALFVNGVNGPVEILVAAGTYTESVLVPPITGASPANPITFRPLQGPGTVQLHGASGDIFALLAIAFAHNGSLTFDGLEFTGAPGHAISATQFVGDIEIRNCVFTAGHQSTAQGEFRHAVLVSENSGSDPGWRVHHNRITLSPYSNRTSYGIYLQNGGNWEIHHNRFDLNGANYGLYLINNNLTLDTIYDNEFVGTLYATTSTSHNSVAVIRADISNYGNEISHNTFAVTIPNNGCCIATGGYVSGSNTAQNYIWGNVFLVQGSGAAMTVSSSSSGTAPFIADGNVFWVPSGNVGLVGTNSSAIPYATLAGWQGATGQDAASLAADPLLVAPFAPAPDLRPMPGSPVGGAAVNTPSYVVDDYAGRLRDAMPDAGAHESTSFALYGAGCPGSNSLVPAMGSTGTAALGSTNFTIELTQAPAGTLAILFGGLSRTQSTAGPLPFPIGGGCEILAAPSAPATFVTSAQGAVSVAYPIPNSPALSGTDLFFQWAVIDPGSGSSYGITVSEGGALQL
ncbi:MAG: right-handed parallel beta-helix repeat-containing protein [Planctomycetes bacterium]|nr:right-handed parallel beta-helix repeat-containing protein [Planctomycetota bacterium]